MARFPAGLFRFPTGELLANFQDSCDTCTPHFTQPGRSLSSSDGGQTWAELPQPLVADVFKACIPDDGGGQQLQEEGFSALVCYTYPLQRAAFAPGDNRTGVLVAARFEARAGRVTQTATLNATLSGWPNPGLSPMPAAVVGGDSNGWHMTHDGSAARGGCAGGGWMIPLYGRWAWPSGDRDVLAMFCRQEGAEEAGEGERWTWSGWINNGTQCAQTSRSSSCVPTEDAVVALPSGGGAKPGQRLFAVWRNQDPTSHAFNQSLMGQNSFGATPY
jgi:hypothetical protein